MRVYISGRTNGLNETEVKQNFGDAKEMLESIGLQPVSPFSVDPSGSCGNRIIKRIELLIECNAILMLSNWIDCMNSRIEKNIAEEMGKMVIFEASLSPKCEHIRRVKAAIKQATGLRFEDYTGFRERHEHTFYARMIFTNEMARLEGTKPSEIAMMVNRNKTTILRYMKLHDDELRFNKDYRSISSEVKLILSK